MATKFHVGDQVWVPSTKLGGSLPYALTSREVKGQRNRSVTVDAQGGATVNVSSRLVHPNTLGFLILTLGDFATEATLLDPLAKSTLQFMRILVPDDVLHSVKLRTENELRQYMQLHGRGISHVILIGHGTANSLVTAAGRMEATSFVSAMDTYSVDRTLISMACKTGQKGFSGVVSSADGWRDCVAPHQEIQGAGASLYAQFLLHTHLLHGHEFKASARLADAATEGIKFRHWRNGRLQTAPRAALISAVSP